MGQPKKTKTGQMAKIKGSKTEHKLEAQPNLDSIVLQYTPNAHSNSRVFSRQQGTLPLPSLWAKPPATPSPHRRAWTETESQSRLILILYHEAQIPLSLTMTRYHTTIRTKWRKMLPLSVYYFHPGTNTGTLTQPPGKRLQGSSYP